MTLKLTKLFTLQSDLTKVSNVITNEVTKGTDSVVAKTKLE